MTPAELALLVAAASARVKGAPGPKGLEGAPGTSGERGARGWPGERGPQGQTGEPGERGETGPAGARGETGSQGPQGLQGTRGEVGARGDRGAVGPQGPTGPRGPQGPKGDRGTPGLRWRGQYSSRFLYEVGDVVESQGSSWVLKLAGFLGAPMNGSHVWDLVAQAGQSFYPPQDSAGGGGGSAWGGITGTLANQIDLQAELNGKASSSHNHDGSYSALGHTHVYEPLGTVTTQIAAHEAASDPHPTYLKQAEGDALYDATGAASAATAAATAALAAHAGAADPHTGYQKESEKGAAGGYASLDGGGTVPDAQIPAAIARDAEVTAAVAAHAGTNTHAQIDTHLAATAPHSGHELTSSKNAVNGYAGLSSGKVAASQLTAVLASSDLTNDAALEKTASKNAASGYAGLSAGSKLTGAQQTYGAAANTACEGNDARLSDARTPTIHAASHLNGGSDAIKLDDLATPDDNTDLNASATRHGLLPKLPGGTANFLRADGAFAAPTASIAAPFAGAQAPGSFTLTDGQFGLHGKRLTLSGSQRATLEGSSRLVLLG